MVASRRGVTPVRKGHFFRATLGRFACASCILVALGFPLPAETIPSVEVYLSETASIDGDGVDQLESGTAAGARLSLDTASGSALKGSARVTLDSATGMSLDRAYFKARFPFGPDDGAFRLTLGKAPLSWGKGFVFNAGDPVFGATPRVTSLSDSEYRTATAWMAVAYVPIGNFSFAEAVYLPRVSANGTETGYGETVRAVAGSENAANRAGLRAFVTPALPAIQSLEAGVLSGDDGDTSAYFTLDGSLWLDWYAAVSARWNGALSRGATPEIAISAGVFRIPDIVSGHPVTIRIESLAYPADNRELWYPSVQVRATDALSFLVQGIFASGNSVSDIAASAETDEAVPGAISALPWIDSGSALLAAGFTAKLLNDIALSGTAIWRFEKGDDFPQLGAQAGFTCTLR